MFLTATNKFQKKKKEIFRKEYKKEISESLDQAPLVSEFAKANYVFVQQLVEQWKSVVINNGNQEKWQWEVLHKNTIEWNK